MLDADAQPSLSDPHACTLKQPGWRCSATNKSFKHPTWKSIKYQFQTSNYLRHLQFRLIRTHLWGTIDGSGTMAAVCGKSILDMSRQEFPNLFHCLSFQSCHSLKHFNMFLMTFFHRGLALSVWKITINDSGVCCSLKRNIKNIHQRRFWCSYFRARVQEPQSTATQISSEHTPTAGATASMFTLLCILEECMEGNRDSHWGLCRNLDKMIRKIRFVLINQESCHAWCPITSKH